MSKPSDYAVCTGCGYIHLFYDFDGDIMIDGAVGCAKCGCMDLRQLNEDDSIEMVEAGRASIAGAMNCLYFV
jgi:predicted  nucleic acid-binding Zn-ribbon protein